MNIIWNVRTAMSGLLAVSLLAAVAAPAMAVENDNDRSTYSAKQFYEKLDQQGGSGGN
jgi:nucleoside-specific outer membrane channel protein Tsx